MGDTITVVADEDVATITLSRPHKLNALDAATVEALHAALAAAVERGTRLLVLRGDGKGFSGGFDFSELEQQTDGDLALRFLRIEQLLQAVHYAPLATMALVHGACYGAAADLVASCTWRIGAPGSRLRMPGLGFGVVLGTRRLAEVVGRDNALALLAGARVFEAEEAFDRGFLTGIAEPARWEGLVAEAAARVRAMPSGSLSALLRVTRAELGDQDLANLARSVAPPGLKRRIQAYLASKV